MHNDIFLHFPLDDYYCELLEQLKQKYEEQGQLYSFRQLLETELLKLELTYGLRTVVGEGRKVLVLDPSKNAKRIPVRIKNKKLVPILSEIQSEVNRSMSKIIYTLVRKILDDFVDISDAATPSFDNTREAS